MDDIGIEQELLEEDEWLEDEPILSMKNVGVVCDSCGGVSLIKYHMARSGFTFICNKCRLKESRVNAHRRYSAKQNQNRESTQRIERLIAKLDRHMCRVEKKIVEFEKLFNDPMFTPSRSGLTVHDKHLWQRQFLVKARMKMLEDLLYNREKTYEYYMTGFGDYYGPKKVASNRKTRANTSRSYR